MERVVALLQTNLKTQTTRTCRPQRNSLGTPGNCWSLLVSKLLGSCNQPYPWKLHNLNSVEAFHERLEKLVVGPNDRVTRADVKDFFVVDEHQYPAKMAVSILNAMDRHLVERNSLFLL